MSSLLEQAIIDAKELREAALRFAENQVIERHAVELKEAIDSFLNEQDEPALDPMAGMKTKKSHQKTSKILLRFLLTVNQILLEKKSQMLPKSTSAKFVNHKPLLLPEWKA